MSLCPVMLTANGRSRRSACPPVPVALTVPTKYLYRATRRSFRRLRWLTAFIPAFTLFCVGQSPTRPGCGGATPTLKTHNAFYSASVRIRTKPNQSKLNETKPNETKKKNASSKNQRFEANARFFGFVFLFMGLQPLKPCHITLTTNE